IKTGIDYTSPSGDEICGGHRFDVMPLGDSNVTDIWIGDSPLLTRYNRRYRLDQDKDCLIIDRIVNGHSYWNWSRADIGTRNMAYLRDLLMEISQIDLSIGDNTCTWSLADDGIFSVRSSRHLIDSKFLPSIQTSTLWDKFFHERGRVPCNWVEWLKNPLLLAGS
ncbi:hypothetical protein Tco_1261490, partial [Tanacetum coccineum]